FLSEARRLEANVLASPMILDLAQLRRWPSDQITAAHPTARGGGQERLLDESKERVTDIAMEWLSALSLPGYFECEQYEHGAEPAGPATEGPVQALLQKRLESPADGPEAQGWTYHVASTEGTGSGGPGGGRARRGPHA